MTYFGDSEQSRRESISHSLMIGTGLRRAIRVDERLPDCATDRLPVTAGHQWPPVDTSDTLAANCLSGLSSVRVCSTELYTTRTQRVSLLDCDPVLRPALSAMNQTF